jgi:DNA-binding CsgD family transcriptional regulator
MPTESKTSARRLTYAERKLQALELRKGGATFQQIGDALGISKQNAHKHVMTALTAMNEQIAEEASVMRTLELERLDKLWFAMYRQATQGNQGAVDRCIRIMERRAKLLGLDAPTRTELSTKDDKPIIIRLVNDDDD